MAQKDSDTFLVDAYSDPAIVKVIGRASFTNSAPLREFFNELVESGITRIIIDFSECTSMDSTFMGIMAGAALDLRRKNPEGKLILCRLGARNLELIRNLGLHRIMEVDSGNRSLGFGRPSTLATHSDRTEIERARLCLEAHENLVEADRSNLAKFQDVISFLKNRAENK